MAYRDTHQQRPVPLYLYLHKPRAAWRWSVLPSEGVGLLRLEHLIGDEIGVHPMALLYFERVGDYETRRTIEELTEMYARKEELFIDILSRHIARVALQYAPRQIFVRFSDYTSAEYASLLGGETFEPYESCPLLGLRGAARYISELYRPAFELECAAVHRARDLFGAINVAAVIPFCRTLDEADEVLRLMAGQGLHRGREHLRVFVTAEVPSNILLATEFAGRFDGFTVGAGDLAQLTLGVDSTSSLLGSIDLGDEAVRRAISQLIQRAHAADKPVHVCGPTVLSPGFFEFLLAAGVDAVTVRPEDFGRARERLRVYCNRAHRAGDAHAVGEDDGESSWSSAHDDAEPVDIDLPPSSLSVS